MKLIRATIKDFRSLSGTHEFSVADGLNYFVGPNNAGKSNVLRALELALDPHANYVPERDRPARDNSAGGAPVKTVITLTFSIGKSGPEQTLKRYAQSYEMALRGERKARKGQSPTYADEDRLHIVTEFGTGGTRVTRFSGKGTGAQSLKADSRRHTDLERQFRNVVRFAVIHSGEDLTSLLKGKFRDILHLVITEHLREEVATAEASRLIYLTELQSNLLEPLRSEIEQRVSGIFEEISSVTLTPEVPTVQDTLASVDIQLADALSSALTEKGTGIRGAVLVSMLQYLAAQSKRSLVLAVEEPEAFLHPGAQESIRGELEALAQQSDVSLLVTTHSPYVIARSDDSAVVLVSKGPDGVTRLGAPVTASDPLGPTLGSLYRDAFMSDILERSLSVPATALAVLVTEGYTDWQFISMCCHAAGAEDLLEGIHVLVAGRAKDVVPQAIIAKAATKVPVIALLDYDENGKEAINKLQSFGWNQSKGILSLKKWPGACAPGHDVEIEDLLPPDAVASLVEELTEAVAIDAKSRCGSSSEWHLKLTTEWKEAAVGDLRDAAAPRPARLPAHLRSAAEPAGGMTWLIEEIRRRATGMHGSRPEVGVPSSHVAAGV